MLVIIGILAVMMRLAGVILWDWWIVLIPFYPVVAALLFVLLMAVVGLAARCIKD